MDTDTDTGHDTDTDTATRQTLKITRHDTAYIYIYK